MNKITKEEFEISYAERSGFSVEKLKEFGLFAIPCDCKELGCKGWQMVSEQIFLKDSK